MREQIREHGLMLVLVMVSLLAGFVFGRWSPGYIPLLCLLAGCVVAFLISSYVYVRKDRNNG